MSPPVPVSPARHPVAAAVLIAAAVLQLAAMAFHPVAHGDSAAERVASIAAQAPLSAHVHGLLILLVLAAWLALAQYSGPRAQRPLVRCAGRLYGLGVAAMSGAALVNGFAAGHFAARALRASETVQAAAPAVLLFAAALNQALAGFGTLLLSCGIAAWSLDLWRAPDGLARLVSVYGMAAATACAIAYLGGLRLDVAGMGAVLLAQALWYVLLGVLLLRAPALR
ncbi:hypothetical protein [Tahibacter harae]|uniref:DUF4386 family protein n=1 Tax=Tahibacter harae TaxID=2963937 RepID=A0ABT1QQZ2_9GAMM|nr:hypothetical protein [Tahibacter harae]MCQ4164720.1 hypothetical protein [Tahibacter harae]